MKRKTIEKIKAAGEFALDRDTLPDAAHDLMWAGLVKTDDEADRLIAGVIARLVAYLESERE